MTITRGIRNHNPGNIRHAPGVTWEGESANQTDPAFVQFDDPIYGLRAIARILQSYQRHGITNIQDAINRWAPPNENNSAAYVQAVCTDCGVTPTANIALESIMPQLVAAIVRHENGSQPYSAEQIQQAIALAA